MSSTDKTIFVYDNWRREEPVHMGNLHVFNKGNQENISFEYTEDWLSSFDGSFSIDPDLYLYTGRQYTPLDKGLFGFFADSCPDRWGRVLMNRKEVIEARKDNRRPRKLSEVDYLLGVFDESRQGAIRFSYEDEDEFLASGNEYAIPPWVSLRTLENAAINFENDKNDLDEKWLIELLAPGSSLGGARPKASVRAIDGTLWIAKFPSKYDEWNTGAWEKVVHDLAKACSLNVPESRLETFSKSGSTFLVKRFDREGTRRVHYASAMTLLGRSDGASGSDGVSYIDIAAYIRANGAEPKEDLLELWKRIVFNMAVSNTDDHLRNHGFLLDSAGWRLSPLFDVNPAPYGNGLSLNVSEYDNSIDMQLAIEVSEYFGLSKASAKEISEGIYEIVDKNWKSKAQEYGLSRGAIEYMQSAFQRWTD